MIPGFDSHLPICSSIIPDKFFAFWYGLTPLHSTHLLNPVHRIPVMTFDFILLVLVTSRAIVHHRSLSDNSWSSSVLMSILVRDSLFYFVWSVVMHPLCCKVLTISTVTSAFSWSLLSYGCWVQARCSPSQRVGLLLCPLRLRAEFLSVCGRCIGRNMISSLHQGSGALVRFIFDRPQLK